MTRVLSIYDVDQAVRTLTPSTEEWPNGLDELGPSRRPSGLFVMGRPLPQRERAVAVVGARNATVAGIEAAQDLAQGLAEAGFAVISGLAVGIDAAAHRAVLGVGGHTVAVLGCGLDIFYPPKNERLQKQIAGAGTVVTEYELGTQPYARNFPDRNRIIVGLSTAVVVVEGGLKSGALITARIALDANRSVFAVPGSIRNPMAQGPNNLIRTCQAKLITEVSDILEDLAPELVWGAADGRGVVPGNLHLEESEIEVLTRLDDVPASPETVRASTGLTHGALALALSRLEVRGLVLRRRGGYEITNAGARARAAVARS